MKKTTLLLAGLVLLLSACHENEDPKPDKGREYVAGDVLVGIKSKASIGKVFKLMNDNNVFIDQMSGFYTYSTLPNDQLDRVINTLSTKPYLNKRGFTGGNAYITGGQQLIMVVDEFFEMDKAAQEDWLQTEEDLQLKDVQGETKYVVIKVKPGKETHYISLLSQSSSVAWADFNYINEIILY